ncbi:hypothetical protein PybrP1_004969 [[Pythium] brassicae (nom. inval.)]|nr:hypothetical protein PybrP1_004969 [[Pythium] brassicae (nom. inval.)]
MVRAPPSASARSKKPKQRAGAAAKHTAASASTTLASKAAAVAAKPRDRTNWSSSRACPMHYLPPELVQLLFPFLVWRDSDALACASRGWRETVLTAAAAHAEWHTTVLTARSAAECLELLRADARRCWSAARFAPTLALVCAGSSDSTPLKTGGFWKSLAQAVESARLVPRGCPVVSLFTPLGVMGTGAESDPSVAHEYEEELEEYSGSPSTTMTVTLTVAHLPETAVEVASFDRKWLRQHARGRVDDAEYPFRPVAGSSEQQQRADPDATPSFLLFSVNATSSDALAPIVSQWHPGAPVVGGIFPFADRCIPISGLMRKPGKQPAAAAAAAASLDAVTLEFPTNLLVRLHGKVGIKTFASCAFQPITPVVRCETVSTAYLLDQFAHYRAYETVAYRHPTTGEETRYRLIDLLRQYGSFARENSLNIYTCASIEPIQAIVAAAKQYDEQAMVERAPIAATVDRLDMIICTGDSEVLSMDKHWDIGRFGFVAVQIPECGKFSHAVALKAARRRLVEQEGTPIGAFVISCALKGQELYGETDVETRIYQQVFPELPLIGCFSGGEVGPVACPLGLAASTEANPVQLQSNTTSGAIFYTKRPRCPL